jgi:SAM-dependent methyltransferase
VAMAAGWDADRYQRQFGFVSAMAGDLVELLDPGPTETVLDLGCGTGELAAEIQRRGARVLALDADPAMVAAARARLGTGRVLLADAHGFTLPEPVDAVFSNAALHWMPRPAAVIARVRAALRPGGRFVAELGGAGNIDAILAAFAAATAEAGLPGPASPWSFPTPDRQATLLEAGGFRVARMEHFARPTPLEGGDHALAAPRLRRDGRWVADYWRLRFVAHAGPGPGTASPAEAPEAAKLHRQMTRNGGL